MQQNLPPLEPTPPPALLDQNGVPPLLDRNNIQSAPGILDDTQRYVPAPILEATPMPPMTDQERTTFRQTPAGMNIYGNTENDRKRDRTTFGEFLANRPGVSDRLIRMGSAMQAASPRGLNAALAAMGQEYANVNADQRAQDQLEAQAQLKAQQKATEQANANQELNDQFESQIFKYDKALEDFELYQNVTGLYDGTLGAFFEETNTLGMGNARKAAFRRRLQKIIVDETLLNTANTKGAISDKEMALFKSAVPSLQASEEAWVEWLKARRSNLIELQGRLRNGVTVDKNADIGFANTYTIADENNTASNDNITDDDEALFDF